MSERNMEHRRKRKHKRKYFTARLFLLPIMIILVFLVGGILWGTIFPKESKISYPPTESLENIVTEPDMQENISQNETTQNPAENEDWHLTLVNKWNPIPENWDVHLVEVEGGELVDERIYEPLMEMLEAAKADNWDQLPNVVSGYRTAEKQQSLYNEKIKKYKKEGYSETEAKKLAEEWVAIPGYSEHQLGFAVDINGATYDLYFWLQENSYKYGFIFRYPGNKTDITGVAEEVWHYRYVGVDAATEIYEQGICLEEYLENK